MMRAKYLNLCAGKDMRTFCMHSFTVHTTVLFLLLVIIAPLSSQMCNVMAKVYHPYYLQSFSKD